MGGVTVRYTIFSASEYIAIVFSLLWSIYASSTPGTRHEADDLTDRR